MYASDPVPPHTPASFASEPWPSSSKLAVVATEPWISAAPPSIPPKFQSCSLMCRFSLSIDCWLSSELHRGVEGRALVLVRGRILDAGAVDVRRDFGQLLLLPAGRDV